MMWKVLFPISGAIGIILGWAIGYTSGETNGRLMSDIANIGQSLIKDVTRATTFAEQFKHPGDCNNCGKSILNHNTKWQCPSKSNG
jgi:hypothetical protein